MNHMETKTKTNTVEDLLQVSTRGVRVKAPTALSLDITSNIRLRIRLSGRELEFDFELASDRLGDSHSAIQLTGTKSGKLITVLTRK